MLVCALLPPTLLGCRLSTMERILCWRHDVSGRRAAAEVTSWNAR
jgi:hypothetical protein